MEGAVAPKGRLFTDVIRGIEAVEVPQRELSVNEIARYGMPHSEQPATVQEWKTRNLPNLWRGARRVIAAKTLRLPTMYGALWLKVKKGDDTFDLGLVSLRVVTTAGVNFLAACFDNTNEPEVFKYHGIGTGTNAESSGDTALQTELTTEYQTDNVRPTGTQTHSTNTYTTVGTITLDSGTPAITEHGIFSQAATGGGTLLDRTKFAAINLTGANGDGIVATYVLTLPAGS